MHETTGGDLRHLYEEFARFYEAEAKRCEWAPDNPQRVFNLAFHCLYRDYRARVSPEELLGLMYRALGFCGAEPPGLFQTFHPTKYDGELTLEDHFVNFFAKKLRWLLRRVPRTDTGRKGDPTKFGHASGLGPGQPSDSHSSAMLEVLSDALTCLDARESNVIRLMYREDLSARKVGERLGVDHKMVLRVRERALEKLRRQYGLKEN